MNKMKNDSGEFAASHNVSKQDVLSTMDSNEPYTTSEVASALQIPTRTAYKYLDELVSDEQIQKKKPNQTTVIWYRSS